MADNSQRIALIDKLLRSGVTSSTVDGTSVAIDPESLREERRRLMAEDETQRIRRPRISSVDISGLR